MSDSGNKTKRSRRKLKVSSSDTNDASENSEPNRKKVNINIEEQQSSIYFDPIEAKDTLRRLFIITLIAGSLLLLMPLPFLPLEGISKTIIALLIMMIYYISGRKFIQSFNTRSVFADSLYYLGFLFTFVALVGAMTSLNNLNVQLIVGQMGPALVTTVFGMAARIYLTQFEPITSEPEEEAIQSLSNLSSQLINALSNIEQVQKSTALEMTKFSKSLNEINFNQLNVEIEKFASQVSQITFSTNEIVNTGDRTKIILSEVNDKYQQLNNSMDRVNSSLSDVEEISNDIDKLNTSIDDTTKKFEQVGAKLEQRVTSSATEASNAVAKAAVEANKAESEAKKLTSTLQRSVVDVLDYLNRQK